MSQATPEEVAGAVAREREYQDYKWGPIAEHPHEVGGYLSLMRKELREAEDAWCGAQGDEGALCEILQVIAVGVACLEQHGIVERSQLWRTSVKMKAGEP